MKALIILLGEGQQLKPALIVGLLVLFTVMAIMASNGLASMRKRRAEVKAAAAAYAKADKARKAKRARGRKRANSNQK